MSKEEKQILVGPTAKDEYISWDRDRIARALEREGRIPRDVAEEVAKSVEQKVLNSGSHHIAIPLIRELVNSELFLMGHGYSLKKQSMLGIPKYNFNSFLYDDNQNSTIQGLQNLLDHISSITLRQYALEEVFSREVVHSHLSGTIHIEDLKWPLKCFSIAYSVPKKSNIGKFNSILEELSTLTTNTQKLSAFVTHSLNVYNFSFKSPESQSFFRAFLIGISQDFSTSSQCRMVLEASAKAVEEIAATYEEIFAQNKRGFLPDLFMLVKKKTSKVVIERLCQIAIPMRNPTFLFPKKNYFLKEYYQEQCAMSAITINLVQAACKAGGDNFNNFWDEIKMTFNLCVKAHLDKKRFLLNLRQGPLVDFFQSPFEKLYNLDEFCCFLQISGLPEAVQVLSGETMFTESGWDLAIQILAYLSELTQSICKRGIAIRLVHCDTQKAGERFFKLDTAHFSNLRNVIEDVHYTAGPHFPANTSLTHKERLQKEGDLHHYVASCVSITPDIDPNELVELIYFAMEETQTTALKVR